KTVWILCAPTVDDVVPTIRSRCRLLTLQTPTVAAVARLLQLRDGVEPELAEFAARVSQGHVGRARALARHPAARARRSAALAIPGRLADLGSCLQAAAELIEATAEEAAAGTAELDQKEKAELSEALGFGTKGARPRHAQAAMKELEEQQKARAKRFQRDAIDRALTELTGFYRDVLSIQTGSGAELVNVELAPQLGVIARKSTAAAALH